VCGLRRPSHRRRRRTRGSSRRGTPSSLAPPPRRREEDDAKRRLSTTTVNGERKLIYVCAAPIECLVFILEFVCRLRLQNREANANVSISSKPLLSSSLMAIISAQTGTAATAYNILDKTLPYAAATTTRRGVCATANHGARCGSHTRPTHHLQPQRGLPRAPFWGRPHQGMKPRNSRSSH
jgi:hypothetical protein